MLNRKHVQRRFEKAASTFDEHDFVHAVTREGLLARIAPLLIEATTVVDLGAATGSTQRALTRRFRGARIFSVDLSAAMLRRARKKKSWLAKTAYLQASADALPFASQSVDVVFANLLLPWVEDPDPIFSEVSRVLRKGGVFAFASLGPDSLQVLQQAWQAVDGAAHVNRFPDMHDVGDGLVRAGLSDPVLDVDRLSVSYESSDKLFADISHVGARNSLQQRNQGLTSRARFAAFQAALQETALNVDLELVYGHCWGAGGKIDARHYPIDAHNIPTRRRR